MNFPLQYPVFAFFYWLVNTTGIGGIFVISLGILLLAAYGRTLGWIGSGKKKGMQESLAYPSAGGHTAHKQD